MHSSSSMTFSSWLSHITYVFVLDKPIIILGDLNCDSLKENAVRRRVLKTFSTESNLEQGHWPHLNPCWKSVILVASDLFCEAQWMHESATIYKSTLCSSWKLLNYSPNPFTTVLANNYRQILSIFSGDHVNTKLHIFNNVPRSTLDSHAPIITREVRNRPCPLVSGDIKELMRQEIGSTIASSCHETLDLNKESRNADNESPLDMSWCVGHNQSYFQQRRMELILNLHFRPISFNLHMIVFFVCVQDPGC